MDVLKDDLALVLLDEQPVSIVFYEPVFDSPSSGIIDFQLVYCNKMAASMANSSPQRLYGSTILGTSIVILDEASRRHVLDQLTHVYRTGATVHEEFYNGVLKKHFRITRNKLRNGVLSSAEDVTQAVLLKEEKEKQTELASRILQNSLNGWFYCEAIRNGHGEIIDFEFIMINPAFTRMVKRQPEEVIGKTHLGLFPGARANGIHELNCRVVTNKTVERKQLLYKGDQLDAWYDVVVSSLGDDGLLVNFSDITHTKQKELEAASLAETLKTVINTAQMGIFTMTPQYDSKGSIVDFRFTMVNPALSNYVAQEPETLIGALGSEWFPGYLHNGVFDMYRETFVDGKTQRKQFHYNVDGIDVYLDLQSTRIGNEVLVTFSDFTPLQLAQLELQKSIRELQRSNQNLEEFTRAASHDLKEPIRKIQLFSDRLKSTLGEKLSENEAQLFGRMENAASRMSMLIDDLLDYSHVNAAFDDHEQVDLNDIVQFVLNDLEVMIDESDAVVECENLPVIHGNRRQLQQLFLNLVSNAVKYKRPGINPHVYIHGTTAFGADIQQDLSVGERARQFSVIEVHDNGIGFDENDSKKIFNVFTRLHNREYAGTGIGLAIAKRVMENHSGYIFARGVKGQGATFTLLFPFS